MEIEKLRRHKQKADSKGNLKEVAQISHELGELLLKLERFEDAKCEFEAELALCEVENNRLGIANAHRYIGQCLSKLGEYDRALDHQQQYLAIAVGCQNLVEQQRAYATLGDTHYQHAEGSCEAGKSKEQLLGKAEIAFKKSLDLCEKLKGTISELEHSEMKSRLFMNLGLVYDSRGDVKMCAEYIKRAIQIAEKMKLYDEMFRCQFNLSGIYQRSGNLSQALRFADMAIKIAVTKKDKLDEKEGHINKGRIFMQLGDISAARKCYLKAFKMKINNKEDNIGLENSLKKVIKMFHISNELNDVPSHEPLRLMKLHEKLGDLATELECFSLALENYQRMEKHAIEAGLGNTKEMSPVYVSIAQTFKDLRQYQQAFSYFEKELKCRTGDLEQECNTWLSIAGIQELDAVDYETVKQTYNIAFQCARKSDNGRLQFRVLEALKAYQSNYNNSQDQQRTSERLKSVCDKYDIDPDDVEEASQEDDCSSKGTEDDSDVDLRDEIDTSDDEEKKETTSANKKTNFKVNEKGETPLHRACIEGNLKKVKNLIAQGHPVNPRDNCGWLPLHEAANHGFVEIVEYLLDKGARLDDRGGEQCGGITPLHDACSCGNVQVIDVLVKRGASVFVKDDENNTPLDSLTEFRRRSQEELTIDELNEIKALENLLSSKMEAQSTGKSQVKKCVQPSNRFESQRNVSTSQNHQRTMKRSFRNEVSGDDSSDEIENLDLLRTKEIKQLQDPATAAKVYKQTISSLRTRVQPSNQESSNLEPAHIPALILEEENVVDDWLIDDVRSTKQRITNPNAAFRTSSTTTTTSSRQLKRKSSTDRRVDSSRRKQRMTRKMSNETIENSDDEVTSNTIFNDGSDDDLNISFGSSPSDSIAVVRSTQVELRPTKHNSWDRRETVSLPTRESRESRDVVVPVLPTVTNTLQMRLKVRIEDKVILIPVYDSEEPQTVSWLAKEAADRYYQLYSRRPILSLSLIDSTKLAPNDLISSLFVNNEELIGSVDRWEMPSSDVRYADVCKLLKCNAYTNIKNLLQCSERTCTLNLACLSLRLQHFDPIVRALQYQCSLKEVDLHGNRLGDDSLVLFVDILHMLPNLTSLNIGNNGLTSNTLSYLSDKLENQEKPLQHLERLILDYNQFGDSSSTYIARCIRNLPRLSYFSIVSCHLTVRFLEQRLALEESFRTSNLQNLDVSLNHFGSTGIELLLKCIDLNKLQSLHISSNNASTSLDDQLSRHLNKYLSLKNCALKELYIDGHLINSDVYRNASKFQSNPGISELSVIPRDNCISIHEDLECI